MNRGYFERLDAEDPLAGLRDLFDLPNDRVYLVGNSLGALPRHLPRRLDQLVNREWGAELISSWNRHDWIGLPRRVGDRIAPLVGAAPGQVVATDSISVNLFKLLGTALALRPGRTVVLSQHDNFPTDLYMAHGLAGLLGTERCSLETVPAGALERSLDETVAVLMLSHVNFRDGSVHDIGKLTSAAHQAGALVIWDLAHSAGVLPLELDAWKVDMAVGCGYKYLNGGPGAPAFLYLAQRHQARATQPLSGWMGHRRAFDFLPSYEAADGIERFLCGTPGVLGLAALDAALDVFDGISINDIRARSGALTTAFIDAIGSLDRPELRILTPMEPGRRGSQVSLAHDHAHAVSQALIEAGVIVDFRAPDIIRFGFSPLYNRFVDVYQAVHVLGGILDKETYAEKRFSVRKRVT